MTDDITPEPEEVTEVVPDPIPDAVPDPVPDPVEEIPEWGRHLQSAVEEIRNALSAPVADDPTPSPDMPDHGHVIPDEKPVVKPWTHRWPWDH